MIRGENIYKSYGENDVIKDISFSIKPSSIFGLLGPNGAGKTTLVKYLLRSQLQTMANYFSMKKS